MPCHPDRSRSASNGAVEGPAVPFPLKTHCHPEARPLRGKPAPSEVEGDLCTPSSGNCVSGSSPRAAWSVEGDIGKARVHTCRITPARVERTLLSAAYDLDLDFDRAPVEERRFSAA